MQEQKLTYWMLHIGLKVVHYVYSTAQHQLAKMVIRFCHILL